MSRYNGSRVEGQPPPCLPKTKSGEPRYRPNKYADIRPSDQKHTSGQKRHRRQQNPPAAKDAINQMAYRTKR